MTDTTTNTYQFPELSIADRVHLQELENLYGRERVISWLRAKVGIPLKHQFDDDFDEDAYFEAMREQYVETGDGE